jgi:hypothetical protein
MAVPVINHETDIILSNFLKSCYAKDMLKQIYSNSVCFVFVFGITIFLGIGGNEIGIMVNERYHHCLVCYNNANTRQLPVFDDIPQPATPLPPVFAGEGLLTFRNTNF